MLNFFRLNMFWRDAVFLLSLLQYFIINTLISFFLISLIFFSRLIFVLQIFINFFLTSFSLLGQYWENLALDRSCTDRAELGSYKNDPGPLFFSTARASEVKRCLWLTEDWPNYMALEDWLEVWPKTDRRLTENWPNYMALGLNLPIMNLPTCDSKTSGLLIVSVEAVHMAKSWLGKNQSEGKNLPQDYLAI